MQNVKECDAEFWNDENDETIKNAREEREVTDCREQVVCQQSHECHGAGNGRHTNEHILEQIWQTD